MPYIRYSTTQKQFLKQHHHTLSAAELAQHLGTTPGKVYSLAWRLAAKWRAENGAPQWRQAKV